MEVNVLRLAGGLLKFNIFSKYKYHILSSWRFQVQACADNHSAAV